MTGRVKKAAAPKKKANGYKMPAPITLGEVINDNIAKKKWRIGPSIGIGGFGEIYSACEHENSPKKGSSYPFVVKIEPHENGPLFVEKHFYIRNANRDEITKFMQSKKLSSLGMPLYFGNGSHDYKGEKYRYLVLERYGKDVWTLFKDAGRSFSKATVFQLGLQMLDVLEYIHSRGYVHADIKGANILMGLKKGTENQAFLVDFGLATRVNEKEFKPDPKCAHNGTIEYTSRDAHLGVSTMRGDLEILGYNMLQWLVGELPWEKCLKQPKTVQSMKEEFMKNVRSRVTKNHPDVPDALIKLFEYINSIKPKDTPDYAKCQTLFQNYLKSEGKTRNSKIEFTMNKKTKTKGVAVDDVEIIDAPKVKRVRKPKVTIPESDDENEQPRNDKEINGKQNNPPNVVDLKKNNRRGRKLKVKKPESDDDSEINGKPNDNLSNVVDLTEDKTTKAGNSKSDENDELSDDENLSIIKKRKSSEPATITAAKKTKLMPKATPPAKRNHANIATQTSTDRRRSARRQLDKRQVSFESPVCEVITDKKPKNNSNSSPDIFEDSFEQKKPKRKLLAVQEFKMKKVVSKKTTVVKPTKGNSWKDCPTILNGRPRE